MEPFGGSGRRSSSYGSSSDYNDPSSQQNQSRSLAGHPLHMPQPSNMLPSPFGGPQRLPSPGDALRGPDRFEHSLDLPPLHGIPRSHSPILPRGSSRGQSSDLPSFGYGSGSGSTRLPRLDSDIFNLPALPQLKRTRSRTGSFSMNLDSSSGGGFGTDFDSGLPPLSSLEGNLTALHAGMTRPSLGGLGGRRSSSSSTNMGGTFGTLPPLGSLGNLNTNLSSSRGGEHSGGSGNHNNATSPFSPSSPGAEGGGEGGQGLSHASRGIRKFSKRATFSQAQLAYMEDLWLITEYPSNDQIDHCAESTGLTSKQIRTWFGNTRQARLAGTRKEARHAGIPGQPGTSTAMMRRNRGDTMSMYGLPQLPPLGGSSGSSGLPPLGQYSSNLPPLSGGSTSSSSNFSPVNLEMPATRRSRGSTGSGGLPTLGGLGSGGRLQGSSSGGNYGYDNHRSAGGSSMFPPLHPLPEMPMPQLGSGGGSGGNSGYRSRRNSLSSFPMMGYGSGMPGSQGHGGY